MKLEDFNKLLDEKAGNGIYEVFIPSLNETKPFKYLEVAQLKSLSKSLLDGGDDSNYLALTSLIRSVSVESLNLNEITEYDRIAILLTIRAYNFSDEEYKIKCPKCKTEFNIKTDIAGMVDRIKPTTTEQLVYEDEGLKIETVIGEPSVKNVLEFKEYMRTFDKIKLQKDNQEFTESEKAKLEKHISSFAQLICVKEIKVNDEELEGFVDLDFMKKSELIELSSKDIKILHYSQIMIMFVHLMNHSY